MEMLENVVLAEMPVLNLVSSWAILVPLQIVSRMFKMQVQYTII